MLCALLPPNCIEMREKSDKYRIFTARYILVTFFTGLLTDLLPPNENLWSCLPPAKVYLLTTMLE